jgi:hypothetical protein
MFGGAALQAFESVSKCKAKSKVDGANKLKDKQGTNPECDRRHWQLKRREPQDLQHCKRIEPGLGLRSPSE